MACPVSGEMMTPISTVYTYETFCSSLNKTCAYDNIIKKENSCSDAVLCDIIKKFGYMALSKNTNACVHPNSRMCSISEYYGQNSCNFKIVGENINGLDLYVAFIIVVIFGVIVFLFLSLKLCICCEEEFIVKNNNNDVRDNNQI